MLIMIFINLIVRICEMIKYSIAINKKIGRNFNKIVSFIKIMKQKKIDK